MANDDVPVNFSATENVTDTLKDIQSETVRTERVVVSSMGTTEAAFDTAARESGTLGEAFDKVSGAGSELAGGLGDLGGSLTAIKDLQNSSATKSSEQARKLADVEQAMADTKQAAVDLEQSQLDLNQSQIDSKQAGADVVQSQLDVQQALLDAEQAQTDYNDAVAESGPDSAEAKQAAQDLAQAQADLSQANIDGEQAIADKAQADADGKQAANDLTQATIDAKTSQLDLADAQREAVPPTGLQEWGEKMEAIAPIIMGVVGAADLLKLANMALSGSWVAQGAAMVASKVALVASTVATGLATAAQWLFNVAVSANPIGLIILAIAALVAAIVWIATKTTWFSDVWNAIWGVIGTPVKALWEAIQSGAKWVIDFLVNGFFYFRDSFVNTITGAVNTAKGIFNWFTSIPSMINNAFSNLFNIITAPFKAAWNFIANGWNNTVGRLSFTVPNWVPGIGGGGFSMPRLPTMAVGGDITREGAIYAHKGERLLPAGTHGLGSGSGGGGGGPMVIEIRIVGDDLKKIISKTVRVFGGGGPNSVQVAFGKV